MRKWVVIGIGAVAIGGIAALVLRPWEDAVQYNIRGYLAAEERIDGKRTFADSASDWWNNLRGRRISTSFNNALVQKDIHEKALLALGYLEDWAIVVSNHPTHVVVSRIMSGADETVGREAVWSLSHGSASNELVLRCAREDRAKWERLVWEADAVKSE